MEGIITWNFFLVGFLTELCLYMFKIIIRHLTLENLLIISKLSSSINLFRYGFYALTGWLSGTREPVLGHKNCGNVSLVVNDYFIG